MEKYSQASYQTVLIFCRLNIFMSAMLQTYEPDCSEYLYSPQGR